MGLTRLGAGGRTVSQAALLVACVSLVVSGLALGWQVAMWLLNGGRIRTQLVHGLVGRGSIAQRAVKRGGNRRSLDSLHAQGWEGPEVLGIQVTNTGRARVQVTAFGIRQGRKGMVINYPSGNQMSPELPTWIEAGSSATWYAELADGTALVHAANQSRMAGPRQLRMTITLGTGKSVITRQYVHV